MSHRYKLDNLFSNQDYSLQSSATTLVYDYAKAIAEMEKCVVVVSDLHSDASRIFNGAFASVMGLSLNSSENSIWEKEILSKIPETEREEKYLAELRFYNFLLQLPYSRRSEYYLASHLRYCTHGNHLIDILHRMYYWYDDNSSAIRYGICLYSPLTFSLPAKSMAINTLSGEWIELSPASDKNILSAREKQVLTLIDRGLTSNDIADKLCVSKNTISRHRQQIIAKLQVKNSTEACRLASKLHII